MSLIDRVIFQKWHTKITLVINKNFSLTEIDMDKIQERLIPSKYYRKSSERLIQTNGEELIIHKLLNVYICNKGIWSADLSSKIVLRNSFIVLTDALFNLILPFIPKEIDSFNNITILKDINERKIYRTERSLLSLKTEILLDD